MTPGSFIVGLVFICLGILIFVKAKKWTNDVGFGWPFKLDAIDKGFSLGMWWVGAIIFVVFGVAIMFNWIN